MRRLTLTCAVAASVAALVGCETITEELPARPTPPVVSGPGRPVVVVPVPIPTPIPAPREPGPGTPGPNPAPQPVPNPQPNPNPNPGPGIPPNIPPNGSPVARVGAKVFFVECQGEVVPNSEFAREAPVGCRIHMDCTPRDAGNRPTTAVGTPQWTYSDPGLINVGGNSPYNPVLFARAAGDLSMYVTIDGVRSDDVRIRIQ